MHYIYGIKQLGTMSHNVTLRFRECIIKLKDNSVFSSYRQIAEKIGMHPQCLSDILKHKREVTSKILEQAVEHLNLNAVYLLNGQGEMFCADSTIETQSTAYSNDDVSSQITYVPIAAQAGYIEQIMDPIFEGDLPKFSLPNQKFLQGTLRCFDVAGDSMEPTLIDGDKIICRKVDNDSWLNNIKSDFVYVIITDNGIVVKRLQNNLKTKGTITLISDNERYTSVELDGSEIKEVWTVVMKINYFRPAASLERIQLDKDNITLKETIAEQERLIAELKASISL